MLLDSNQVFERPMALLARHAAAEVHMERMQTLRALFELECDPLQ